MVFVNFLKAYGEFLETVGRVEKESGKTVEELFKEALKPENYSKLVKNLPKDLLGEFFYIMLSIASLHIKKINEMTPEEKIEIGKQIVELSKRLEEVLMKIEEWVRKHEKES